MPFPSAKLLGAILPFQETARLADVFVHVDFALGDGDRIVVDLLPQRSLGRERILLPLPGTPHGIPRDPAREDREDREHNQRCDGETAEPMIPLDTRGREGDELEDDLLKGDLRLGKFVRLVERLSRRE